MTSGWRLGRVDDLAKRRGERREGPTVGRVAAGATRFALSWWARNRRRIARVAVVLVALGAVIAIGGAWTIYRIERTLPDVSHLAEVRLSRTTTILSSDGETLATLQTRKQKPVSLSVVSPWLVEATIATEDARFYEHSGVDWRGVFRATLSNLRRGNLHGQGGSTLTQQLARNLYLSNVKTFHRKIEEILLAQRIEQRYSKSAILEAYLNTVYYGGGNYGVEAAARGYFSKPAHDLTLGEAALLAGIPQRPTAYALTTHLAAALERRKTVLARMRETGDITADQERRASLERPIILHPLPTDMRMWRAPYFVADVIAQLRGVYGSEFLHSGATVETTLNWRQQQAAERTLREAVRHGNRSSTSPNTGAIVSIDPRNGYVRALVGGPSFAEDQFDAATQGIRQPGSAFKPFVYATAFDLGVCNLLSSYQDAPISFPSIHSDDIYKVHNYDGRHRGSVTVLDALRESVNTVAVQVGKEAAPANISIYAERMGITTPLEPSLPLALGASGVHPLEICSAYAAFANRGDRYTPTLLRRITDVRGKVLFEDEPAKRRHVAFLKRRTLDEINVALREVVLHGTGVAASSIPDAHGKTGTTSSHRDAWFVGYNADLATAIWVAHRHREAGSSRRPSSSGSVPSAVGNSYLPMGSATGGDLCAPMWASFMRIALPEQRRVNRAHGILPVMVPAPERETLLASLRTEVELLAQQQRATNSESSDPGTAHEPYPRGFEPAENGSGPIIVQVPDSEANVAPASNWSNSSESSNDSGNTPDRDVMKPEKN